jgi:hypothetical protein
VRRFPIGPFLGLAVLGVVTLLGGQFNTTIAQGRVVDDWSGQPIKNAHLLVANQQRADSDAEGRWYLGPVPNGARLSMIAAGYGRVDFTVPLEEIRMVPATLTIDVFDAQTNAKIRHPEVRSAGKLLQTGTETGSVAVVHPGRGSVFQVCAHVYHIFEGVIDKPFAEIKLEPDGPGCPPLPSPTPSPTPAPATPTPSPTASP